PQAPHTRRTRWTGNTAVRTRSSYEQHRLHEGLDLGADLVVQPHLLFELAEEMRDALLLERPSVERVVEQPRLAELRAEEDHGVRAMETRARDEAGGARAAEIVLRARVQAVVQVGAREREVRIVRGGDVLLEEPPPQQEVVVEDVAARFLDAGDELERRLLAERPDDDDPNAVLRARVARRRRLERLRKERGRFGGIGERRHPRERVELGGGELLGVRGA